MIGNLKKKYVTAVLTAIITHVILFFTAIGNAAKQAYKRKPAAMGAMNLKISVSKAFLSM
jgi:hypothetical protein